MTNNCKHVNQHKVSTRESNTENNLCYVSYNTSFGLYQGYKERRLTISASLAFRLRDSLIIWLTTGIYNSKAHIRLLNQHVIWNKNYKNRHKVQQSHVLLHICTDTAHILVSILHGGGIESRVQIVKVDELKHYNRILDQDLGLSSIQVIILKCFFFFF